MDRRAACDGVVEGSGVIHVASHVLDALPEDAPRALRIPREDAQAIAVLSKPLDDRAPEHPCRPYHQDDRACLGRLGHLADSHVGKLPPMAEVRLPYSRALAHGTTMA